MAPTPKTRTVERDEEVRLARREAWRRTERGSASAACSKEQLSGNLRKRRQCKRKCSTRVRIGGREVAMGHGGESGKGRNEDDKLKRQEYLRVEDVRWVVHTFLEGTIIVGEGLCAAAEAHVLAEVVAALGAI